MSTVRIIWVHQAALRCTQLHTSTHTLQRRLLFFFSCELLNDVLESDVELVSVFEAWVWIEFIPTPWI